jgi:hypothetical protein
MTTTSRILIATADELDHHATIAGPFGVARPECMTDGWLDLAVSRATATVLRQTPGFMRLPDQEATADAARAALPTASGTVSDYAARLRALAGAR